MKAVILIAMVALAGCSHNAAKVSFKHRVPINAGSVTAFAADPVPVNVPSVVYEPAVIDEPALAGVRAAVAHPVHEPTPVVAPVVDAVVAPSPTPVLIAPVEAFADVAAPVTVVIAPEAKKPQPTEFLLNP